MTGNDKVKRALMGYLAAVGSADHVFTTRDFNTQVLIQVYKPEERAGLDVALGDLIAAGLLAQESATQWRLTPAGVDQMRAMKIANRADHPDRRESAHSPGS